MSLWFLILVISVLTVGWSYRHTQRRSQWQVLDHVAGTLEKGWVEGSLWGLAPLELRFRHPAAVFGTVRLEKLGGQVGTVFRLRFLHPFPTVRLQRETAPLVSKFLQLQDIELDAGSFDYAFRVVGWPVPAVRALLNPPVRRALLDTPHGLSKFRLSGTEFVIFTRTSIADPQTITAFIRNSLACYELCVHSHEAPWRKLASSVGFSFTHFSDVGCYRLDGVVGGAVLSATFDRGSAKGGHPSRVTITGSWKRKDERLDGLHLCHREMAETPDAGKAVQLNNPVLEQMIAVTGENQEDIRAFLGSEGVVEALLPLVHAHPGSIVQEKTMRVIVQGREIEEIEAVLEQAIRLSGMMHTWSVSL